MVNNDLESLISQINQLLETESLTSVAGVSGSQPEVLAKIRNYLNVLQQQSQFDATIKDTGQKVAQVIIAQVDSRLAEWVDNLKQELNLLQQQKNALTQEIKSLEQNRQHIIASFLEIFIKQNNQILQEQITKSYKNLAKELLENKDLLLANSAQQNQILINQQQEDIANILKLQQNSQGLLNNLNITFRNIFQSFEEDLKECQQVLSQELDELSNLGQQTEAQLANCLGNITEQLEQSKLVESTLDDDEINLENPIDETENDESPVSLSSKYTIRKEDKVRTLHPLLETTTLIEIPTELGSELDDEPEVIDKIEALTDLLYDESEGNLEEIISGEIDLDSKKKILTPIDSELTESPHSHSWYLGLDFRRDGLSAVLFSLNLKQYYPIYWCLENEESLTLETIVYAIDLNSSWQIFNPNESKINRCLEHIQSYFNLVLPFYDSEQKQWQPQIKIGAMALSLHQILQAFSTLLKTLQPSLSSSTIKIKAPNLSESSLQEALNNLETVICSCPYDWGDIYRFNVREAILDSHLVKQPEQILFVENTIASLLAHLQKSDHQASSLNTLLIHINENTTELAIVKLPKNLSYLTYKHCHLRSFNYGGYHFEQDIFCRLIYPQWISQLQSSLPPLNLEVPETGKPDCIKRDQITIDLQNHPLGKSFLEAAKLVKLILQQREEFTSEFGNQKWGVKRQELETKIITPFLDNLDLEVNHILADSNKLSQDINQIICSGEMISVLGGSLSFWLAEKFTKASVIQHEGHSDINHIAMGLSVLPLFPKVFNRPRHQYTDYFLLLEMFSILPHQPFRFDDILYLLRQKGINTRACSERIKALLDGEIDLGLTPSSVNTLWFTESSLQNLHYQTLDPQSLFYQDQEYLYHINFEQVQLCQEFLNQIILTSKQNFQEPMVIDLTMIL